MAQSRSTKIISMIQWIRTSRLSIKDSLDAPGTALKDGERYSAMQAATFVASCTLRVWCLVFGVEGSGCRVQGVLWGLGFRVYRLAFGEGIEGCNFLHSVKGSKVVPSCIR